MVDSRPRGGKTLGQRWVGTNFDAKKQAQRENGGVPPRSVALDYEDMPENQLSWSADNLPEILFYLRDPPYHGEKKPEPLRDDNGNAVKLNDKVLFAYDVLPTRIPVNVEGWRVEAWRRLDPRITYSDIIMRMTEDPNYAGGKGLKKPNMNALQNTCRRACRRVLGFWMDYNRREEPHRSDVEAIEQMSYNNVVYNTILPLCRIDPNRLVRVRLYQKNEEGKFYSEPVEVTKENLMETTYPIDYFARGEKYDMDDKMMRAWELSLMLQERADRHGKDHWHRIPKDCLPLSWSDRVKEADRPTVHDTYDGGCNVCSQEAVKVTNKAVKVTNKAVKVTNKAVKVTSTAVTSPKRKRDSPSGPTRKRVRRRGSDRADDSDADAEDEFEADPVRQNSDSGAEDKTEIDANARVHAIDQVADDKTDEEAVATKETNMWQAQNDFDSPEVATNEWYTQNEFESQGVATVEWNTQAESDHAVLGTEENTDSDADYEVEEPVVDANQMTDTDLQAMELDHGQQMGDELAMVPVPNSFDSGTSFTTYCGANNEDFGAIGNISLYGTGVAMNHVGGAFPQIDPEAIQSFLQHGYQSYDNQMIQAYGGSSFESNTWMPEQTHASPGYSELSQSTSYMLSHPASPEDQELLGPVIGDVRGSFSTDSTSLGTDDVAIFGRAPLPTTGFPHFLQCATHASASDTFNSYRLASSPSLFDVQQQDSGTIQGYEQSVIFGKSGGAAYGFDSAATTSGKDTVTGFPTKIDTNDGIAIDPALASNVMSAPDHSDHDFDNLFHLDEFPTAEPGTDMLEVPVESNPAQAADA